tara:strand:- start:59 stop:766 length:708 start_codon:yes stop_codon:yes gene_type:complete
MAKGIGQFISQTLANFASPNLFRVDIAKNNPFATNPLIRERLSLVCHNAQIPGLTMVATDKDLAYRSNVRQKTYDDITLAFHCNDDMLELKYFQDWMEAMVDPSTNRVGFYNDYVGTLTIRKLSRQTTASPNVPNPTEINAKTLVTTINEAYPKRIEPLSLDYSGTGVMSLSINFSYRNYEQEWVELNAGGSAERIGEPIFARRGSLTEKVSSSISKTLNKLEIESSIRNIGGQP